MTAYNNGRDRIPVELYFDYICPFCYVGSSRLDRIAERYPVSVHYRFVEIHPDTPPEGRPVSELGYAPEQWRRMTAALEAMVAQDGLAFIERTFTTNSRKALLLAQASLDERPDAFPGLHRGLLHAYFAEGRNIGDDAVLADLAAQHGVEDLLTTAWESPHYRERLLGHVEAAQRLGLTGVPTLVVGGRAFAGAVSMETLEQVLAQQGADAAPVH